MISAKTEEGFQLNIPSSFNEYKLLDIIGNGSTSVVALVENEDTGQLFSAKIIPKMHIEKKNLMNSIQNEIKILNEVDHPNILKFYKSFHLKNRFGESYIIMILEYCENGDLLSLISEDGLTNEILKKKIIYGFLEGIRYLHGKGISHGDIKPENILLDKNFNPKITDFGYSRTSIFAGDEDKKGTLNYAAPELFTKGIFNTLKSDIWAIGITIYCLSENNFPFKRGNANFVINQIISGKLCFSQSSPKILQNLVEKCTDLMPTKRPTIDEIINDEYFSFNHYLFNGLFQNKVELDSINEKGILM